MILNLTNLLTKIVVNHFSSGCNFWQTAIHLSKPDTKFTSSRKPSRVQLTFCPARDSSYSFQLFLKKVSLDRDCISNPLKPTWGPETGLTSEIWGKRMCIPALTGVGQRVGHHPANWRVAGSIPGQSTCLGCECVRSNKSMFLTSMFLSLSAPL